MRHAHKHFAFYFVEAYKALHLKMVPVLQSAYYRINDYFQRSSKEDAEDLAAFAERADEPTMSYQQLVESLEKRDEVKF